MNSLNEFLHWREQRDQRASAVGYLYAWRLGITGDVHMHVTTSPKDITARIEPWELPI